MATWKIGAVGITRIVESVAAIPAKFLLPGLSDDALTSIAWLQPEFATGSGRLRLAIQALVVETPGCRIVVDTCVGNDRKGRTMPEWNDLQTPFLTDFANSGFDRRAVDFVFCTHLHSDHVGWNTMWDGKAWVPTFPNARYLVHRGEFDYWSSQSGVEETAAVLADAIEPVRKSGQLDQIELPFELCPEVTLVSTPGHTPGHASVQIASEGERAMISGDFIHNPCQMALPDLAEFADVDPALAAETRRQELAALSGSRTLLIGTHFPPPTAGRVRADGAVFRFDCA